ncbi:MAG: alpha/beta fold hydrolase [Gemmatimonadota bacterium]
MRTSILLIALAAALIEPLGAQVTDSAPGRRQGAARMTMESAVVEAFGGVALAADAGVLIVPESRTKATRRVISIPFYRLRSTSDTPASPIFLLHGGPGGSMIDGLQEEGTVEHILFYRGIADVVIFDQRGGGHALPELACDETSFIPSHEPVNLAAIAAAFRETSARCRADLVAEGVDLGAYNTIENAADMDALRSALGYERVTLIGGSYGTHLALTVMRLFPETVDRVVLHGVEGLDHTWDSPAGRLAVLERHAAAAEASAEMGSRIPAAGLIAALRGVIERLDLEPVRVPVPGAPDGSFETVGGDLIRFLAGYEAGQRNRPNAWPEMILALSEGDYSFPATVAREIREEGIQPDDPVHYTMDCASGISSARRERLAEEAGVDLLGGVNWEYEEICPVWDAPDLGDDFRSPLESAIPTVIVHGTWDYSTPIENAREVAATLSNSQLVEVVTGTHGALYNVFGRWQPMKSLLAAFLRGEEVRFPGEVQLEVQFTAPEG